MKQGEIFGLIGPNGAGKTTCFNMISGALKPTSGTIEFKGQRIDGNYMYQTNRLGIARTYQNINLFGNMTVLENILVGQHCRLSCGLINSVFRTKKQKEEEKKALEKAEKIMEFVGLSDLRQRPILCRMENSVCWKLAALLPAILSFCCWTNRQQV